MSRKFTGVKRSLSFVLAILLLFGTIAANIMVVHAYQPDTPSNPPVTAPAYNSIVEAQTPVDNVALVQPFSGEGQTVRFNLINRFGPQLNPSVEVRTAPAGGNAELGTDFDAPIWDYDNSGGARFWHWSDNNSLFPVGVNSGVSIPFSGSQDRDVNLWAAFRRDVYVIHYVGDVLTTTNALHFLAHNTAYTHVNLYAFERGRRVSTNIGNDDFSIVVEAIAPFLRWETNEGVRFNPGTDCLSTLTFNANGIVYLTAVYEVLTFPHSVSMVFPPALGIADMQFNVANSAQLRISGTLVHPTGARFDGWATRNERNNVNSALTMWITQPILSDMVFEPVFSHQVTFNLNGGSVGFPAGFALTQHVLVDRNRTIVAAPHAFSARSPHLVVPVSNPTRANHVFLGWTNSATGVLYPNSAALAPYQSRPLAEIFRDNHVLTNNITFTAQWQHVPPHTVRFESMPGQLWTTRTVATNATLANPGAPARAGFVFDGWYTNGGRDNGGQLFAFNSYRVTSDMTLVAAWISAIQVTFDSTGGNWGLQHRYAPPGGVISHAPNQPTRHGYNFVRWYLRPSGETWHHNTIVTQPITVFAEWQRAGTARFLAPGSNQPDVSRFININGLVPWFTHPTRPNYQFNTWLIGDATGTPLVPHQPWNTNMVTADGTILVATWRPEATVRFMPNGGTNPSPATRIVPHGGLVQAPTNNATMTRANHNPGNWYHQTSPQNWNPNNRWNFATDVVNVDTTLIRRWYRNNLGVQFVRELHPTDNALNIVHEVIAAHVENTRIPAPLNAPSIPSYQGAFYGWRILNANRTLGPVFNFDTDVLTIERFAQSAGSPDSANPFRLVAYFHRFPVVTLAYNNNTNHTSTRPTRPVGDEFFFDFPAAPRWPFHDFHGWFERNAAGQYIDVNGNLALDARGNVVGVPFTNNTPINGGINDNVRLYAVWTPVGVSTTFVTGYNDLGGEFVDRHFYIPHGTTIEAFFNNEGNPFTDIRHPQTRFSIVRWYTNPSFMGSPIPPNFTVTFPITLYAYWEFVWVNPFTVSFVTNSDESADFERIYEFGDGVNMPTGVVREGYDLVGWYCANEIRWNFLGTEPVSLVPGNVTLFARWEVTAPPRITVFNVRGGNANTGVWEVIGDVCDVTGNIYLRLPPNAILFTNGAETGRLEATISGLDPADAVLTFELFVGEHIGVWPGFTLGQSAGFSSGDHVWIEGDDFKHTIVIIPYEVPLNPISRLTIGGIDGVIDHAAETITFYVPENSSLLNNGTFRGVINAIEAHNNVVYFQVGGGVWGLWAGREAGFSTGDTVFAAYGIVYTLIVVPVPVLTLIIELPGDEEIYMPNNDYDDDYKVDEPCDMYFVEDDADDKNYEYKVSDEADAGTPDKDDYYTSSLEYKPVDEEKPEFIYEP